MYNSSHGLHAGDVWRGGGAVAGSWEGVSVGGVFVSGEGVFSEGFLGGVFARSSLEWLGSEGGAGAGLGSGGGGRFGGRWRGGRFGIWRRWGWVWRVCSPFFKLGKGGVWLDRIGGL